MKKSLCLVALAALVSACGGKNYPTVEAPNLTKPKISMRFDFPEGSTCRVETAQGTLTQSQIPGKIDFPMADRLAPASCTLADGTSYNITTHHHVPSNAKATELSMGLDGKSIIVTLTTDSELLQIQPTGTVTPK